MGRTATTAIVFFVPLTGDFSHGKIISLRRTERVMLKSFSESLGRRLEARAERKCESASGSDKLHTSDK